MLHRRLVSSPLKPKISEAVEPDETITSSESSSSSLPNIGPHFLGYYELPSELIKTGEESNLIQIIRDALEAALGEEKAELAIINPFASISYLFDKNGLLLWQYIRDIDIKILLPDKYFRESRNLHVVEILGEPAEIENNQVVRDEKKENEIIKYIAGRINTLKKINVKIVPYSSFFHKEYGYDFVSDLFGQPKELFGLLECYGEKLENQLSTGYLIGIAIDNIQYGGNIIKAYVNPGELNKIKVIKKMYARILPYDEKVSLKDILTNEVTREEYFKSRVLPYEGLKSLSMLPVLPEKTG